jgi:hypothetical protein
LEDLFKRMKGEMRGGVEYDVPSTFYTLTKFLINIAFYSILTWYFDHVDSSNRGKNFDKLFFLDLKYWCKTTTLNDYNINYTKIIENLKQKLNISNKNNGSYQSILF